MADNNDISQMQKLIEDLFDRNISGCFMECGVYKGGMSMWMQGVLINSCHKHNIPMTNIPALYMFDTFSHFPKPSSNTNTSHINNVDIAIHPMTEMIYTDYHTTDQIIDNFKKFGLPCHNTYLIQGNFFETIPCISRDETTQHSIRSHTIALLRIDSDYYETVMLILNNYYRCVVEGGYVVVDDYNNKLVGCKRAVDEFRKIHDITSPIIDECDGPIYWLVE
jgi:hypothetical protein